VIEENKRADHALLRCRQHAAHGEFTQIFLPRLDAQAYGTGPRRAGRIVTTEIGHGILPRG
jgi:hypothetical protein